jgi:transposase
VKTEEDALDIVMLKKQGLSERHIARRLGIDPRTVKKYAEDPQAAVRPRQAAPRPSALDPFAGNVVHWIEQDPQYQATWIYDRLKPMGFAGGYEIVKRLVRRLKGERNRVAYLRFETEPAMQAQVDFGEFVTEDALGRGRRFYCFSMILGYSRMLYCELVERCDLTTFLDCHIHGFEYFGGVPRDILYDRMKNVFIRKLTGRTVFNSSLMECALHYGFKPEVTPAYAPWVKGKVERPYSFVREGFWRGYAFSNLETANLHLLSWLNMKSTRIHGTTHERVIDRYCREKPWLTPMPGRAFDTSYKAFRTAGKDCCVHFECNRYMVPHTLVGKPVLVRVKDATLRIFHDQRLVVTYAIPGTKGNLLAESRLINALKEDRQMNRRKYASAHRSKGRAFTTISPTIPGFALQVERRTMDVYAAIAGEVSA